jgi:hypothetical protein
MSETIIIALFSLCGTLIGTFGGIVASSKLTNYRLEQLEKKVEAHNSLVTRTYDLEKSYGILENRTKVSEHRISDIEGVINHGV